jgi:hypothetical protein
VSDAQHETNHCTTLDPRSLLPDATRDAILAIVGKDLLQKASEKEQDLAGFGEDGAPKAKKQKRKPTPFEVDPPPATNAKLIQSNGAVRRTLEKIRPQLKHLLECDSLDLTTIKKDLPKAHVANFARQW